MLKFPGVLSGRETSHSFILPGIACCGSGRKIGAPARLQPKGCGVLSRCCGAGQDEAIQRSGHVFLSLFHLSRLPRLSRDSALHANIHTHAWLITLDRERLEDEATCA